MFRFSREHYTEQHQSGLVLDEHDEAQLREMELAEQRDPMEEEEEEADQMDESPDSNIVFSGITESFVFPEPAPFLEENATTKCIRFTPTAIPPSIPKIPPGIMKGLAVIKDLTIAQKRTICGHMCMPMPVNSSPVVCLFMTKVVDGAIIPWKPQYVNYMLSVFQLREFMLATINGLIEFHATMTQEKIQYAFEEFKAQVALYERTQETRVNELFLAARANPASTARHLLQFIEYLEDYTLYYIHTIERFLYTTLIEPHCSEEFPLTLANVLTPNVKPSLDMCLDPLGVRKCVVDFFAMKVAVFKKHDAEVADVDYVHKETLNPEQLQHRIAVHPQTKQIIINCPQQTVYRGYIDLLTIYEYFHFCDSQNILGNEHPWDVNSWSI